MAGAEASLGKAYEIDPDNAAIAYNLGLILAERGLQGRGGADAAQGFTPCSDHVWTPAYVILAFLPPELTTPRPWAIRARPQECKSAISVTPRPSASSAVIQTLRARAQKVLQAGAVRTCIARLREVLWLPHLQAAVILAVTVREVQKWRRLIVHVK